MQSCHSHIHAWSQQIADQAQDAAFWESRRSKRLEDRRALWVGKSFRWSHVWYLSEGTCDCGGHSCLMCDDWWVFGEQHAGCQVAWVRNQEQRDFFSSQEQVFLNHKPGQIHGSLSVCRYGNIFTGNEWHVKKGGSFQEQIVKRWTFSVQD